jgi:hypothetical protein
MRAVVEILGVVTNVAVRVAAPTVSAEKVVVSLRVGNSPPMSADSVQVTV